MTAEINGDSLDLKCEWSPRQNIEPKAVSVNPREQVQWGARVLEIRVTPQILCPSLCLSDGGKLLQLWFQFLRCYREADINMHLLGCCAAKLNRALSAGGAHCALCKTHGYACSGGAHCALCKYPWICMFFLFCKYFSKVQGKVWFIVNWDLKSYRTTVL